MSDAVCTKALSDLFILLTIPLVSALLHLLTPLSKTPEIHIDTRESLFLLDLLSLPAFRPVARSQWQVVGSAVGRPVPGRGGAVGGQGGRRYDTKMG